MSACSISTTLMIAVIAAQSASSIDKTIMKERLCMRRKVTLPVKPSFALGTSVKTYFGQVVTVKSVQDSALRIVQVQVRGVEIDCPYSAFSNEDGNYDIPMLEPSGELPKNMHAGVITFLDIDVFDPIEDKLLLEANSTSEPEALLFSLHICDDDEWVSWLSNQDYIWQNLA